MYKFEVIEEQPIKEVVNFLKLEKDLKDFTDIFFTCNPSLVPYKDKMFIAGGCIRSMILGEDIKDVDIFIKDQESVQPIIEASILSFKSDNALNFHTKIPIGEHFVKVQIVHNQVGSPKEITDQFDFTMNMNSYDFQTQVMNVEHFSDIVSKTLRVNKHCRNKLGTLARIVKFVERGYKLHSKENLLELGCQISRMSPISTFTELEEESRLYFSDEEYHSIDFVEKDDGAVLKFQSRYRGSGL